MLRSGCDAEPIHTPGTIQPHGALLLVDPGREWTVVASSRNLADTLEASPGFGAVWKQDVAVLFGAEFARSLRERFHEGTIGGQSPWQTTQRLPPSALAFDVSVHAHGGFVLIELDRAKDGEDAQSRVALHQLHSAIDDLGEESDDLLKLAEITATRLRLLTGYERVIIYKFDNAWNGQAVVENKVEDWRQSLSGLHFPATDIPKQARALYMKCKVRCVADRDATPCPIDIDPDFDGEPEFSSGIDLSFARLRSLSPIHRQYNRNMGVNGSMSLSILENGRLWGLAICHHRLAFRPSIDIQMAGAVLINAFALRIGAAERDAREQDRRGDLARLSSLLANMAKAEAVTASLTTGDVTVCDLFDATGAVVVYGGNICRMGDAPPDAAVQGLIEWLSVQASDLKLFHTDSLPSLYAAWEPYSAQASGLLAVSLSSDRGELLMWFRPEEKQVISWGGNPSKILDPELGELPRKSFERWVETRHGFATPWAQWELEIADTLRHGISEVVVRSLQRISELDEKLRQSQKMEVVGQLTGGIAHDFNNLLAGMVLHLGMMEKRIARGATDGLGRHVQAVIKFVGRAGSLTHRLLAFARRQTLDPKIIDVGRLLMSLQELINRTVGPGIKVEVSVPFALWMAFCDGNQLENAILNLVLNARDAMSRGGVLTLVAVNIEVYGGNIKYYPELSEGGYVEIAISDTGNGMTTDTISQAFEPFFTTKPEGQGTGLGLSMVYGFSKQSNGHTTITSQFGVGTTVSLYLPRHLGAEALDAVAEVELPPALPVAADSVVLLVDDEADLRLILGEVLRDIGYQVIEAGDAAEGLTVLASDRRIDLLISDVGLPGEMNGRQLGDAARRIRQDLGVLFITGFVKYGLTGESALESKMQVMTKPFTNDAFLSKVKEMVYTGAH
jgi:light-regulated signal transduction histidine kinase (bacteriophytochrome)/CheY-like chemotaxis protein